MKDSLNQVCFGAVTCHRNHLKGVDKVYLEPLLLQTKQSEYHHPLPIKPALLVNLCKYPNLPSSFVSKLLENASYCRRGGKWRQQWEKKRALIEIRKISISTWRLSGLHLNMPVQAEIWSPKCSIHCFQVPQKLQGRHWNRVGTPEVWMAQWLEPINLKA